jgi:hypothetical protein
VKIMQWAAFGQLVRRTECRALDLRKMTFVKDKDATWAEVIGTQRFFIP